MDFLAILKLVTDGIGTFLGSKDKDKQIDADTRVKMQELQQKALEVQASLESKEIDLEGTIITQQSEINKADAESNDKFRTYARPSAMWVGVIGLAYTYIILPGIKSLLALTIVAGADPKTINLAIAAMPALDMSVLLPLVMGLLGLGYMRSKEKQSGLK